MKGGDGKLHFLVTPRLTPMVNRAQRRIRWRGDDNLLVCGSTQKLTQPSCYWYTKWYTVDHHCIKKTIYN